MSIAPPERLLIAGPAGELELLIEQPAGAAPQAVAVCCHPHPLFGGSLTNKVVHTMARAFVSAGAAAVRFNFRGVGASVGVHDEGRGEREDLLAVVDWARRRWPSLPLWLGGFSFGAWISLRAQAELAPALLVSVAPPIGRWDFSDVSAPTCPWLVVQGSRDELVDPSAVAQYVQGFGAVARWAPVAEADHFFHGQLHALRAAVEEFVARP